MPSSANTTKHNKQIAAIIFVTISNIISIIILVFLLIYDDKISSNKALIASCRNSIKKKLNNAIINTISVTLKTIYKLILKPPD